MCQWFKLPDLPVSSGTMYDMYFVNANTGWITFLSPNSLIKTTNGGINWIIQSSSNIRNIQFMDSLVGYANGIIGTNGTIWKTTDGGSNWSSLFVTGNGYADIFFVNKDTGWTCGSDGNIGGVWRTNDGGNNWFRQYSATSISSLSKIFFLKNKVNGEYWGWTLKSIVLWRTTNSGTNWTQISSNIGGCNFSDGVDIYFKDTSYGIITRGLSCFNTTSNGGFNWVEHIESKSISSKIGVGDSNKLWLTIGGRDSLLKTNNFFQTYGIQVTASYSTNIFALDTSVVYAGYNMTNIEKTTNGGGPIIYTGIDSQSVSIPVYFSLYQNYPNPFNPTTTIKFFIRSKSYVTLSIFDVTGKEVLKVYDNNFLSFGTYKSVLDFGKLNLSSGVYFYRLSVVSPKSNSLFTETKKMVMIK
jgi:photosystem II stability/assembly factor-like uncharacterized protein